MAAPAVSLAASLPARRATRWSEYQWLGAVPLILVHLAPLLAFWTGTRWQDWAVCVALYWIRMFFVTGFYHRYFSHRTYKTSRWFQFVMAFLAMTSSQKGAIWWAAHHRAHHKFSDHDGDPHDSRRGFWYSHIGWLYDHTEGTDYSKVRDLTKYPELMFLNRFWYIPPAVLGTVIWWFMGWSGLLIGFALSTAIHWHGTFTINSLTHIFGKQRYAAGDNSKNHWLLAIITMGEGWHNNHHYYMTSTRQGFYWWEIDGTYYLLKLLSVFRLIWDLREPPASVFDPANQLPERVASPDAAGASVPTIG